MEEVGTWGLCGRRDLEDDNQPRWTKEEIEVSEQTDQDKYVKGKRKFK